MGPLCCVSFFLFGRASPAASAYILPSLSLSLSLSAALSSLDARRRIASALPGHSMLGLFYRYMHTGMHVLESPCDTPNVAAPVPALMPSLYTAVSAFSIIIIITYACDGAYIYICTGRAISSEERSVYVLPAVSWCACSEIIEHVNSYVGEYEYDLHARHVESRLML